LLQLVQSYLLKDILAYEDTRQSDKIVKLLRLTAYQCGAEVSNFSFPALCIFAQVKQWLSYILTFYILISTVVPCSLFDHCEDEAYTTQSSPAGNKKDCNNCSPFSVCSSHCGFTINTGNLPLAPAMFYSSPVYGEYSCAPQSKYCPGFFQPPRRA
jgi:hypothetical protein